MFTPSPDHPLLHSSLLTDLGITHGFTTRPLNITLPQGPTLLSPFTQTPSQNITLTPQSHGCAVSPPQPPAAIPLQWDGSPPNPPSPTHSASNKPNSFDAHISTTPDRAVAVRTADCIPLLIAAPDGRTVAAIHAGWRGLVAGIIPAALHQLQQHTPTPPSTWLAALGPCISVNHYQVGQEVAQQFTPCPHTHLKNFKPRAEQSEAPDHPNQKSPPFPIIRYDLSEKPHLDLRAAALAQLISHHLTQFNIDIYPGCTFNEPHLLPSYRRDGPGSGHLAAFIKPH